MELPGPVTFSAGIGCEHVAHPQRVQPGSWSLSPREASEHPFAVRLLVGAHSSESGCADDGFRLRWLVRFDCLVTLSQIPDIGGRARRMIAIGRKLPSQRNQPRPC